MKYCKAYLLKDISCFDKWSDLARVQDRELGDDSVVYIKEDLTVTTNALEMDKEEDIIYDTVDDEWEAFCRDVLKFEVPDWEEESRRMREERERQKAEAAKDGSDETTKTDE